MDREKSNYFHPSVVDQSSNFFVIVKFKVDFKGLAVGRGRTIKINKGEILFINYKLVQELIYNSQVFVI